MFILDFMLQRNVQLSNQTFLVVLCARYGYRVHPVYTFGECDTYITFNSFMKDFRMKLNKYKIPTVLFWGSYLMPLFPRSRAQLHTIVGPSIAFPKLEGAALTDEAVDKWHGEYVKALEALFDNHKGALGKGHMKLDIR
jgi:2-acylglycerol O-acyltransferase 2